MALNPFFLQGSPSEQRLVQSLINEHLQIHGVEVIYIPRNFVNKKTIIEEVQSSRFDDNYAIEAYVNTYEGYAGGGDILTKFGMSLRDEVTLTISKERFEDFIGPFLGTQDNTGSDYEIELSSRPREGDLVYFPLGQRLFEVKFVEHEQPFYQLGRLYVYELKCELFEYEDEIIDTSIYELDSQVQEEGFITTLNLIGAGVTAQVTPFVGTGYIDSITLSNDGNGYTSTPTVSITESTTGNPLHNATAVAITTVRGGVHSIKEIILTNAGNGYTVAPTIAIIGGGGSGAIATCGINTTSYGIVRTVIDDNGSGYAGNIPTITFSGPVGGGLTATGALTISSSTNQVNQVRIVNPGYGYSATENPSSTISNPSIITGIGTFTFNEIITGQTSNTVARVKSWDQDTRVLKLANVGIGTTTAGFLPGETIVGTISSARYTVKSYVHDDTYDKYTQNDEIEEEADDLLDFTESNPFGEY